MIQTNGLWRKPESGWIWIPNKASNIQLRLFVISHTSAAGYCGSKATTKTLAEIFIWDSLEQDVELSVKGCTLCVSTTGGRRVPRSSGPALHDTEPNDLVQFHHTDLGVILTGEECVLMLREDHSCYTWLYATAGIDADQTALASLDWCEVFGIPKTFMSDGPSRFGNETICLLTKCVLYLTTLLHPTALGAMERWNALGRKCFVFLTTFYLSSSSPAFSAINFTSHSELFNNTPSSIRES